MPKIIASLPSGSRRLFAAESTRDTFLWRLGTTVLALLLAGCQTSTTDENRPAAATPSQVKQGPVEPLTAHNAALRTVRPFDGIAVDVESRTVEIKAWTCLDAGWLEQVACSPRTREHESLVVVEARPSHIHAALLMAGHEPGAPGGWTYTDDELTLTPPTGQALEVFVRYVHGEDGEIEEPIRTWIRDDRDDASFPGDPWIFGGSHIETNAEWMGPGEHYVADMTGSIIGLVTFGDEIVGFGQVLSDQDAIQPPQWKVREERVPPMGTEVTIILRPFDGGGEATDSDPSPSVPSQRDN